MLSYINNNLSQLVVDGGAIFGLRGHSKVGYHNQHVQWCSPIPLHSPFNSSTTQLCILTEPEQYLMTDPITKILNQYKVIVNLKV